MFPFRPGVRRLLAKDPSVSIFRLPATHFNIILPTQGRNKDSIKYICCGLVNKFRVSRHGIFG